MNHLLCYKTLPVWNAQTLPEAFRRKHNTSEGTWAQLTVHQGSLELALTDQDGNVLETHHCNASQQPHGWRRSNGIALPMRATIWNASCRSIAMRRIISPESTG